MKNLNDYINESLLDDFEDVDVKVSSDCKDNFINKLSPKTFNMVTRDKFKLMKKGIRFPLAYSAKIKHNDSLQTFKDLKSIAGLNNIVFQSTVYFENISLDKESPDIMSAPMFHFENVDKVADKIFKISSSSKYSTSIRTLPPILINNMSNPDAEVIFDNVQVDFTKASNQTNRRRLVIENTIPHFNDNCEFKGLETIQYFVGKGKKLISYLKHMINLDVVGVSNVLSMLKKGISGAHIPTINDKFKLHDLLNLNPFKDVTLIDIRYNRFVIYFIHDDLIDEYDSRPSYIKLGKLPNDPKWTMFIFDYSRY